MKTSRNFQRCCGIASGAARRLLDVKAKREELWLKEKFPGYSAYQARVRKLIPFVY